MNLVAGDAEGFGVQDLHPASLDKRLQRGALVFGERAGGGSGTVLVLMMKMMLLIMSPWFLFFGHRIG